MSNEIQDLIKAVNNTEGVFLNKKQVVESTGLSLSYYQWKGMWQRNPELDEAILAKLKPSQHDRGNILSIEGVSAADTRPDHNVIYDLMSNRFNEYQSVAKQKAAQKITFRDGPIMVANQGCVHFGSVMDIKLLFDEARLVLNTPNSYLALNGDIMDNYIFDGFAKETVNNRKITITEESEMSLAYFKMISSRLIAVVAGNHDLFSEKASGIDPIAGILRVIESEALYDKYQLEFILDVAGLEVPVKMRHNWRGYSIYNPTHGIERDLASNPNIRIGVGAHTHNGPLVRERLNAYGEKQIAIQLGTYKSYDSFSMLKGFPKQSTLSSAAYIIDPNSQQQIYAFSSVIDACRYMEKICV